MKPIVDLAFRLAYRSAYQLMRVYWKTTHPSTHGALVLLWCKGEVLLVRNSYVPYYSLPGGYAHVGESGRQAAKRELVEELGLEVAAEDLRLLLDHHHDWEGKREHVELFELDLPTRPSITVDNREVIAAEWHTPASALASHLFPPIRLALQERQKRQSAE